jgi:hypothetical protein
LTAVFLLRTAKMLQVLLSPPRQKHLDSQWGPLNQISHALTMRQHWFPTIVNVFVLEAVHDL